MCVWCVCAKYWLAACVHPMNVMRPEDKPVGEERASLNFVLDLSKPFNGSAVMMVNGVQPLAKAKQLMISYYITCVWPARRTIAQ